jgi:hypothetical protein
MRAVAPFRHCHTAAEHCRDLAHFAERPVTAAGLQFENGTGLHRQAAGERGGRRFNYRILFAIRPAGSWAFSLAEWWISFG